MYPDVALLIRGEVKKTGSAGTVDVIDPATEEVLATLPAAGAPEAREAAITAFEGFRKWSAVPAFERSKILHRAAELMRGQADTAARVMSLEQGKPLAQASGEWLGSADIFDWFAEEARRSYGRIIPSRAPNITLSVLRRPVGPVAAFAPWNFPAWTVTQKVAPALAAGCSVVLKPSEETPGTAWLICRALLEAGVEPLAISMIFGDTPAISEALIQSDEIRKVSLTGSTRVGRIVAGAAGQALKKVTMELGGHAPVIVARDADLDRVVSLAAQWKFRNAGQVCTSPTRFIVEEPLHDRFVEGFADAASKLKVGRGTEATTQVGPLTNRKQYDIVSTLVEDARSKGATVATGGEGVGNRGYFYAPTVISGMTLDMRAMHEEPFGPLALVTSVASIDEALAEANRLPVGLGSYAFTRSHATAARITAEMNAGLLGLNHFALTLPETPFGGIHDSGFGSEGGSEGLEAYLTTMLVTAMAAE